MTLEHPNQHCQSRYSSPPPRNHRRSEVIVEAFEGALSKRWGTTKARRNHTVIAIVQALAGLPTFAAGGRAAYPAEKLALRCHRHVRTVEDALAKLREFPELVRVLFVRKGQPDWRGVESRIAHLEFQVGPVLRGLIEHSATAVDAARGCDAPSGAGSRCVADGECAGDLPPSDTVAAIVSGRANRLAVTSPHRTGVTAGLPPCETGPSPGLTPGDLNLALPTDLELLLKRPPAKETREDQLNFRIQYQGQPPTNPTDAQRSPLPHPDTATDHPEAASPPPSSLTVPLTGDAEPRVEVRDAALDASCPEPLAARIEALTSGRDSVPLAERRNERRRVPPPRRKSSHQRPARLAPSPLPDTSPVELRFPSGLLDAIIRQHRAIAERKGPYVPISADDRARVDGALCGLSGRREDDALLELCARVSESALRDACAKGGTVANLRYTFGGPEEEPDEPGDPRPRMEDVALAIDRINSVTDLDIRTVNSQWTGLRTFAPDGELVIGEEPDNPGFFWLVGLGGIGIATSPAYGSLLASLAAGSELDPALRAAEVDPFRLSPARFR